MDMSVLGPPTLKRVELGLMLGVQRELVSCPLEESEQVGVVLTSGPLWDLLVHGLDSFGPEDVLGGGDCASHLLVQ
jgi:hypothetical protein